MMGEREEDESVSSLALDATGPVSAYPRRGQASRASLPRITHPSAPTCSSIRPQARDLASVLTAPLQNVPLCPHSARVRCLRESSAHNALPKPHDVRVMVSAGRRARGGMIEAGRSRSRSG